jgi:hypothetical protein
LASGTGGRRGGLKDQWSVLEFCAGGGSNEGSFSGELTVGAPKTRVRSLKIAQKRTKSNVQRSIF